MNKPALNKTDIRRILIALVEAFQSKRIAHGKLPSNLAIQSVLARRKSIGVTTEESLHGPLLFDEETLGVDSLTLLDLVLDVTHFFNLKDTGVEDYLILQRSLEEWVDFVFYHLSQMSANARFSFSTSGSSGVPRSVTKNLPELYVEIQAIQKITKACATSSFAAPKRTLVAVSPHHIYGFLWGVLLPRSIGSEVLDCRHSALTGISRCSKAGDMIVATPFLWERWAASGVHVAPECLGVCSGGPTRPETWEAADALGLETFLEVYGSTETGGIGTRHSGAANFMLMPHLEHRGKSVTRVGETECLDIQDVLSWKKSREFLPIGRLDNVVQVAGTNVNLTIVHNRLAALPMVQECAVRLDGDRLKAFVVPTSGYHSDIEQSVRSALRDLPTPARPDQIRFGNALPRTEAGKLCDW